MTVPESRLTGDAASPLDPDDAFEILRNRRRRLVVEYLTTHRDPATVRDLSEFVTAREEGKPREEVTTEERRSVYVGLYQCHLPKMDESDVVEFDRDRNLVSGRPALSAFEPYLAPAAGASHGRSWFRLYPRLVAGGLVISLLIPLRAAAYGPTVARAVLAMSGVVGLCVLGHLFVERHLADRDAPEHDGFP